MKRNEFRCIVCQEIRERGNLVKVVHGSFRGYVVKVCKKADCAAVARSGARWDVDPLALHKDAIKRDETNV
jgi:hypothetical protein